MQYDNYEFEFTTDLEIGIPIIDKQHREYFRRLNLLLKACGAGTSYREIESSIKFLEEYAYEHLDSEEFLMSGKKYPSLDSHKKAHEFFKNRLCQLIESLSSDGGFTEKNLSDLLEHALNWFLEHIKNTDKKIGVYLKSKP